MKKRFALLLAAVMCLSLCACGGGTQETETIEITTENWQDYFEVKLAATVYKNAFGEIDTCFAYHYVYLKREYRDKLVDADVAFGWSSDGYGLCVFTHNLETGALSCSEFESQSPFLGIHIEGTFSYKYNAERQKYYAKINTDGMGTISNSTVANGNTVTWKGNLWEQVVITRAQGTLKIAK